MRRQRERADKSIFGGTIGAGEDSSARGLPGDSPGSQGNQGKRAAGDDVAVPSRLMPDPLVETTWAALAKSGAVHLPPYDPSELVIKVEQSDTLPGMIDAVAVNVSGHGTSLEPRFPTEDEDGNAIKPPKGSDVERLFLEAWLERANVRHGFEGVCERVDRDVESIGWGIMEILRSRMGRVEAVEHIPAWQTRLGKVSEPILVEVPAIDPATGEIVTIQRWMRFRLILQVLPDQRVRYFKEFGDPRRVNYLTGETRPAGQEPWKSVEGSLSLEASEVLVREIYCPYSPYGVPRWIGASAQVSNGRKAGELVFRWFTEAPIGAKVLAVAGGKYRSNALKRITDKIDDQGRGDLNAFAFYGLEAAVAGGDLGGDTTKDQAPRFAVVDLAEAPPKEMYAGDDSLINQSSKSVRATFRLPPVYIGQSEDYSRAAADTARAVGEEQVIDPIRRARWHRWFDSSLLPSLGIRYWKLRFVPSVTGDDVEAAAPIAQLAEQGGASPNALIKLSNRLMKSKEPRIKEAWGNRPLALTLKMLELGMDPNGPVGPPPVKPADQAAAAQLGPDGKPLPTVAPNGQAIPPGGTVQDAGYSGIQISSLLEIQKAVADGWLKPETAANTIVAMFPHITPEVAKTLVADIDAGSTAAMALADLAGGGGGGPPGAGGKPPGGKPGGGKPFGGAKPNDRAVATKMLTGLAMLDAVRVAVQAVSRDAERAFDPSAIAPSGE